MKYANEEEILALQEDPVKYNPGKIAHETAFRGAGNEVIYPDKVHINLEYLKRQSFWLDLKIIVYTVLGKKGRWKSEVDF